MFEASVESHDVICVNYSQVLSLPNSQFALGIILGSVLDGMSHSLITSLPVAENVYDVGVTITFISMIHSMYDSTI